MVKNKYSFKGDFLLFVLLIIRKMNKMMWRLNNPETKKEHICRERKKKVRGVGKRQDSIIKH